MHKILSCLVAIVFTVLASGAIAKAPIPMEAPAAEAPAPQAYDQFSRLSPRGTFRGFLKAVGEEDYALAANYLNLSKLPRAQREQGADLAQQLRVLLDRKGLIPPDGTLSESPDGNLDDGLAADLEDVASIRNEEGPIPVQLERVEVEGQQIWLISTGLVSRIKSLAKEAEPTLLERIIGQHTDDLKIRGVPAAHWLAMVMLYAVTWFVAGALSRAIITAIRAIFREKAQEDASLELKICSILAFRKPLQIFLTAAGVIFLAVMIGVSATVRHFFMPVNIVLAFSGIGLFVWSLINVIITRIERRSSSRNLHNVSSILTFARRGIKLILLVITAIIILNAIGIDVTAGLAALGIGGIALALGAQKTLENFIGSISIVADQPFYIGDFCRIGNTSGVIEDIGMRSTRIRTNDRTLVTIPNGELSTQRIENLARRNRFLFNHKVVLAYGASSHAIREFVKQAKDIIAQQPKISHESRPVRMLGFSETGYTVEFWCYVLTTSHDEFLEVQEEVLYALIDAAEKAGIEFSTRTPAVTAGKTV
ncbi:MAG: mechanosensitive ion channel family protein [Alphaproteobacteria bacterium]|nr:mechanosensitive ion channel family protein [Alphaproteobacteria bacterium]